MPVPATKKKAGGGGKKKAAAGPGEKLRALMAKKFGKGSVSTATLGMSSLVEEVIPTGISALDNWALTRGGLPVKRIVELYSDPQGGKSGTALAAAHHCQKEGGLVIWVDAERSFDLERCQTFGVKGEDVLVVDGEYGEHYVERTLFLIRNLGWPKAPALLVVDSIDALTPRGHVMELLSKKEKIAEHARLVTKFVRAVAHLAPQHRLCALFVNQVRNNIGVSFGDPTKTPGGDALKFYASVRIQGWPGQKVKDGLNEIGKFVTWKVTKNKCGVPGRKLRAKFLYETGWDDPWTTLELAKDFGLVPPDLKATDAACERARARMDEVGWKGKIVVGKRKRGKGDDDDSDPDEDEDDLYSSRKQARADSDDKDALDDAAPWSQFDPDAKPEAKPEPPGTDSSAGDADSAAAGEKQAAPVKKVGKKKPVKAKASGRRKH